MIIVFLFLTHFILYGSLYLCPCLYNSPPASFKGYLNPSVTQTPRDILYVLMSYSICWLPWRVFSIFVSCLVTSSFPKVPEKASSLLVITPVRKNLNSVYLEASLRALQAVSPWVEERMFLQVTLCSWGPKPCCSYTFSISLLILLYCLGTGNLSWSRGV